MIQTIAGAIGLVLGYYAVAQYFDRKSKPKQEPEEKPEPVEPPRKETATHNALNFHPTHLNFGQWVISRFTDDSFITRYKLMELMRDPSVKWITKDEGQLELDKKIHIRGNGMEIELEYSPRNDTWSTKKVELVDCENCKWRGTNACFCKAPMDVHDNWHCSEAERVSN